VPLKFLSKRSVQTLPPPIQAPVDAIALAIQPVFDPVSPAVQGPGQVLVASCLCAVGPAIQPGVYPVTLAVQTVVDAVALSIQAVFDLPAFALGLSLRKGYPKCEKEHTKNGHDSFHLSYPLI
jgi:hypothetical protein